jgi:hypothetical protein
MPLSTGSRSIAVAAAMLWLVASDASIADEPIDTEQRMADFIKGDPDCLEFSDECSICAMADGKPACSTPKIACIKKAYVCTRRTKQ